MAKEQNDTPKTDAPKATAQKEPTPKEPAGPKIKPQMRLATGGGPSEDQIEEAKKAKKERIEAAKKRKKEAKKDK